MRVNIGKNSTNDYAILTELVLLARCYLARHCSKRMWSQSNIHRQQPVKFGRQSAGRDAFYNFWILYAFLIKRNFTFCFSVMGRYAWQPLQSAMSAAPGNSNCSRNFCLSKKVIQFEHTICFLAKGDGIPVFSHHSPLALSFYFLSMNATGNSNSRVAVSTRMYPEGLWMEENAPLRRLL